MLALAVAAREPSPVRAAAGSDTRPNIVLILTDDQRYDTLWSMPEVERRLVAHGATMANAFVVNPLCCPSRTSILTGQYSHSTGVYLNEGPTGPDAFDASDTIAVRLRNAGYRTALIGKYLNHYDSLDVPPGWSRFVAQSGPVGVRYYDYTLTVDGVAQAYGDDRADYSTTVYRRFAVDFLSSTTEPFFLYLAPVAPHAPATPAPRDRRAFRDLDPWRPPSFDEPDVSEKPAWLSSRSLSAGDIRAIDELRVEQYRALRAVDRMVAAVVETLKDIGRLRNTLIVFASDNGLLWGEHRLAGKNAPYEESIRIPMVVRWGALGAGPSTIGTPVLNIDLAPTFADAAGVPLPGAEGASVLPLLDGSTDALHERFPIEHQGSRIPSFCAVRSRRFAYTRYATGEEELYDLRSDPWQLRNRATDPRFADRVADLRASSTRLCDPPPPGYTPP